MAELDHAAAVLRAFIAPERQERFLALLGSERGREKLRRALAHLAALDARYARRLPSAEQTVDGIGRELRARGAPAECVQLAEDAALDGQRLPLDDALRAVVGRGMGAFVSCVPGRLAYFEGESVGERYLLERAG
jgi:hypothetical protein